MSSGGVASRKLYFLARTKPTASLAALDISRYEPLVDIDKGLVAHGLESLRNNYNGRLVEPLVPWNLEQPNHETCFYGIPKGQD